MKESLVSEELAEKAIDWFVRLRAEDVLLVERNAFFLWLKEDRLHQLAFIEILNIWDGLSVIKDMDGLQSFPRIWEVMQNRLNAVAR